MMENFEMYDLPSWALENEADFPLGAKATPSLPSATELYATSQNGIFELPEWMESREILGHPGYTNFFLPSPGSCKVEIVPDSEEDYLPAINPEDMLVPPSELKPPPPPIPQPTIHIPRHIPTIEVSAPIPKIVICKKVIRKDPRSKIFEIKPHTLQNLPLQSLTPGTVSSSKLQSNIHAVPNLQLQTSAPIIENQMIPPTTQIPVLAETNFSSTKCDADDLINEMVQLIGKDSAADDFTSMNNTVFTSMVEDDMVDLLSQLESANAQLQESDTSYCSFQPTSPVYLPSPSPVPSTIQPASPVYLPLPSPVPLIIPPSSPVTLPLPSPAPSTSAPSTSPVPLTIQPVSPIYLPLPSPVPSTSWTSAPASPVSLPSPVPSVGSLSPNQSAYDSLFATLLSPSDDESGRGSSVMEDELQYNLGDLEAHSYSRSPSKKKASRKSSRKTPYPEDRRERKKEQNKQAALRYRQKKKQEEDDGMARIRAEEERQKELKAKYASIKQELGFLKKMMREVFIAKGVSPDVFKKKR